MSASTPPPTYTLEDLTSIAGVTARTVRYYIAEGLLPPPDGAGPASAYTDTHRNRLLLIGILKDAYLPLKEIRRRMAAMSEAEIADAVADRLMPASPTTPSSPRHDAPPADVSPAADAAAYIDHVLEAQRPTLRRTASPRLPAAMPAPHQPSRATASATATWKRLSIAPEAELLIEEDAYRRRQEQVDAALDWLRRILNGS
ncbi:MAG: MerR family transcriptional regulator [Thermomicrobiales bacterium]